MLGTYASFLLVLGLSALVGQAILTACGRRTWSFLAPAIGLAALISVAWGTVRLPGEGTASLIAISLVTLAAAAVLRGRVAGVPSALRMGAPVALLGLVAASLPFIVEGGFGILGTGLNPDMSQHLFAADRLASGGTERLISDGYPLGPHALVVALAELGVSTVEGFNGLTLAIAVAACVAPLELFGSLAAWKRIGGALVVGLVYLVASYHVQGAFKETMQALFVLAFAIGLYLLARGKLGPEAGTALVGAIPLAVIAVGSVYAYSFPGLAWLAGAVLLWAAIELALTARRDSLGAAAQRLRAASPVAGVALAVLAVAIAPEVGRLTSFAEFETFNPDGAGLGNLFNRLSPLEALGVWPSGDFRVEPGDGSVPAICFYLGAAVGLAALAIGIASSLRRSERVLPAAWGAALVLWLYALIEGTPYQEAKALVMLSPLVALLAVRGLSAAATPVLLVYLAAAGGSSVLALANGPVGPESYSPALAELRQELREAGFRGSLLVRADREFFDEGHGRDYLVWELRGNRICVAAIGDRQALARPGIELWLTVHDVGGGVVPDADAPGAQVGPGYVLSPNYGALARGLQGGPGRDAPGEGGPGPCPFIPDGARADPAGDG
jgi:hypothetical protein